MRKATGLESPSHPLTDGRDVLFGADALSAAELDALPYGMMQLDERGVVRRYNAAEARISGLTSDECVGRSFFDDIAPCTHVAEFYGRFLEGVRRKALDAAFDFTFAFRPPRAVHVRMLYAAASESVWVRVVDRAAERPAGR